MSTSSSLTNSIVIEENNAALSKQYQRKTDKQHILDTPDTYIGSIENVDAEMWVYDEDAQRIALKTIEYIPGLYKLFDEGIVNCRDHVIRMIQSSSLDKKTVSYINITITEEGIITLENDGNGIDIAKHPEYDIWIPEMIFGHLRTSTNYDKTEKKIVGGKNGFGFKLVLIWSVYGKVETVDHIRGLSYSQEFHNNLDSISPPVITKVSKSTKPYTKVSFKPDYARLGIHGLTSDMLALMKKRIYDIGAITDHSVKKIKIGYNNLTIPVKNFQQYIDLYIGNKDDTKRVYEQPDERWEYAVAMAPTHEFTQISFVNGICTFKGGKHVEYIMGQITRKLSDYIEKKKKVKVNLTSIKEQIVLFLRCDVENPSFDSQTKDFMNTPMNKFGSSCSVSDTFIEKVAKMGVMDLACSLTEAKETRIAKKTDGSKTKTVRGIANFIDANLSGTPQSKDCVLILCEGLSALSGIVSGLSSSDRNTIGIYPLKGKLLNVRGEQIKKIAENKEITDIKKIVGLETGCEYSTIEDVHQKLRYGKIMIMTDADTDGSHIKGLCINLFHSEWASLIKIPGFISFMNTPILRAKKGHQTLLFYNDGEYKTWKDTLGESGISGWTIKYFKGLGTSTSTEFKEYFANKKIVDFTYSGVNSDETIDKIFNKKRADDRKMWLEQYDKHSYLDTGRPEVQYEEFMNNELIHFSTYDCARSIPNMMDGLKISLRKILFSAFKRKLTSEIKVAQFSGYVSEHSAYHHGEASLNGAIINMAQTFVGSNNINLLVPNGQFGGRLAGGDDSASERYIFTLLNPLTRRIFPIMDDAILEYLHDDGTIVEPEYYIPIIPFALINGISGIGTGFSCNIASYNPTQIIQYLKNRLEALPEPYITTEPFIPYYEGFKGTITSISDQKFMIRGVYSKIGEDKIQITELPVGTWTMPYITFLEGLLDGIVDKNGKKIPPCLKDMTSMCTEVNVDITITFPKGKLVEFESVLDTNNVNGLEKLLKLTTTITTTNMHLFNHECKLHKYESIQEIMDEFYEVRIQTYQKRKDALVSEMERLLVRLSNRAKYILEILDDTIDLRRKTSAQVCEILTCRGYAVIDGDFKYLTKMPMDSVTTENVDNIVKEQTNTELELVKLKSTPVSKIWLDELTVLEQEYNVYKTYRENIQNGGVDKAKSKTFVIKKSGVKSRPK
jgi:DNA topoisomerase-2